MTADKKTWNEEKWGPLAFREFDKCPGCGCPNRYSVEAMRGEMPEKDLEAKPPAMGYLEHIYDTPLYRVRLVVALDSCCECGMIYPVARNKSKKPLPLGPVRRG